MAGVIFRDDSPFGYKVGTRRYPSSPHTMGIYIHDIIRQPTYVARISLALVEQQAERSSLHENALARCSGHSLFGSFENDTSILSSLKRQNSDHTTTPWACSAITYRPAICACQTIVQPERIPASVILGHVWTTIGCRDRKAADNTCRCTKVATPFLYFCPYNCMQDACLSICGTVQRFS